MQCLLEVALSFKGKEYKFQDEYGWDELTKEDIQHFLDHGECQDGSRLWDYWWEEGNGACDCNRSLMSGIAKEYPGLCNEDGCFPCGDTIELKSVNFIKLL